MKSRRPLLIAALLGAVVLLSGCTDTATTSDDAGTSQESDSAATDEPTADDTNAADATDGTSSLVTVPGDGTFLIGTDLPYGGYQIAGEPDEQPAGCSWSIVDADGEVQLENQGVYVFLTDVPEFVTFITAGCGSWEQFE